MDRTRESYLKGYKAPCVVAPCGAGKSVIISDIARMTTEKGNRVLFLVHRRELVEQIRGTFKWNNVNLDLVHFGMVQTVVRRLDRIERPDLIITDENHHALASTYRKIYDHFHDVLRLGFTATPIRLNGDGLGDVNDILIEEVDAEWLIENGYLSPYRYYAPKLIDTEALKLNSMREFSNKSIEDAMSDRKKIFGDAVQHYRKLAEGEQAIAYCHSVEASRELADEFRNHGITAQHLDATTPKVERDDIIQKFRDRQIQVLSNVDLIGEGFDVPDCSTVIMLRPTQSLSLYIQQSMRGMRYRPGKTSIIIDHVGNVNTHGLPDMKREWSLDKRDKSKKQEKSEITVKQCLNCFMTVPTGTNECPGCGHGFEIQEREIEVDPDAELEEVTKDMIILDLTRPEDCENMSELYAMAKRKGYKPGWAYHQGKRLGLL